ncbi:unnamed protein product [Ambrosiozyma monospora]|uniref:Unnamed protein product n=1 Tax=Ambrosiozyma monospora TaxID=43982 RepID=A0ACB5THC9_AMBMO|nr:unnamed protein product [Ambrosiozyma monospora]
MSIYDVALGFLKVADVKMANSIRKITESRGYAAKDHVLVSFGGAGSQNCLSVASNLGIQKVIIHKYSSILSAYGISKACISRELSSPLVQEYSTELKSLASIMIFEMEEKIFDELSASQNLSKSEIEFTHTFGLRYKSSNTIFQIDGASSDIKQSFLDTHFREFGFLLPSTSPIMVCSVSVKGEVKSSSDNNEYLLQSELKSVYDDTIKASVPPSSNSTQTVYFENHGAVDASVYQLQSLQPGMAVHGPALLIDQTQTIVVNCDSVARILSSHVVIDLESDPNLSNYANTSEVLNDNSPLSKADPIMLTVFGHRFMAIAETMGRTLQRTSVSSSIKERLDFSCAIFGPDGGLVANAPHIPIHLGSMQYHCYYTCLSPK